MAGFITAAIAGIGSSGIGSAIVRILVAYGLSRLLNKQAPTEADKGIRLQLQPDTTNPIPLLYGSAYFSGNITDAQLTNDRQTLWTCLTLSEVDHLATRFGDNAPVNTFIEEVYWNSQVVTFMSDGITIDYCTNSDGTVDTSPRGLVKIYLYKDGSANGTLPSDFLALPTPPALPADARSLFPGWEMPVAGSVNQAMTKLTFALVKVDYNRDKGITSLPTLKFKVSNNLYQPGTAIYSFMRNSISGPGFSVDEIDSSSLYQLNSYAAEAIDFYNEDTDIVETLGDRYQINGLINPQKNAMANLQEIAISCGVFINYDITTGKWGVKINRDAAPVLHFDDSNITSGIDLTGTSLDSQYNSIELEFPSRMIQDQFDIIALDLPAEYRNDNEPDNVLKIRASMLNEPVQARQLAYMELYQNRADRVITFTSDYSKINVESADIITVTNAVYGFVNQQFRVIRVREIENEEGGLAVEITAQEYDSTIYTAGGQPRRPRTPTEAIDLPSIGVINAPIAPIVIVANNNRQPSILLTGIVPYGLVDRFEFWYSTDNWVNYNLIVSEKNANGSPYTTSNVILARVATLPAGTYKFKARAGNESVFSDYSAESTELVWAPVQTTDATTESTSFISSVLPSLAMGALAYFAYKALYPQLLEALSQTELGKLLGIEDPAQVAAAKAAIEAQAAAYKIINAGGASLSAALDDSVSFIAGAGIDITVPLGSHDIVIALKEGAYVNPNDYSSGLVSADFNGNYKKYLDNCRAVRSWPAKKHVVPATPARDIYITGESEWYDVCYKKNVWTLTMPNLELVQNIKVGETAYLSNLTPIIWTDSSPTKNARTLRIRRVEGDKYTVLRTWIANNAGDTSVPLWTEDCTIDPWDRALFPSTDYPNYLEIKGYDFARLADLTPLLGQDSGNLILATKAGTPEVEFILTPKPEIYVFARICLNPDGTEQQLDFN